MFYLLASAIAISALFWNANVQAGAGAFGAAKVKQDREKATAQAADIPEAPRPIIKGPATFKYLRRSDTPFSPRWRRPGWTTSFKSFHANRILWSYANGKLVDDLKPSRVPMQCTVPFWTPAKDPNADAMACLSKDGGYGGPASDTRHGLRRPDINSAAWRTYQLGEVKKLIDTGCTTFQQDDPVQNGTSLPKGCYAPDSVTKFKTYLATKYPASKLSTMGVTNAATFDVRKANSTQANEAYAEFQRQSVEDYHGWLHREAAAYLKIKNPSAKLIFSGNLTNEQLPDEARYIKHFDFILSEFYLDRDNAPQEFRRIAKALNARASVSALTIASNDVWLNQRGIASAYALGLVPLAPWDIYIAGGAPRFNGQPSDFANLFRVVRSHPNLFDNYASYSDETGRLASVVPIDGVVSKSSTEAQIAAAVAKTRAATPNVATPLKRIARGRLGMVPPTIKIPSTAGYAKPEYITTVRLNSADPTRKVVHLISWREPNSTSATGTPTISILLKRADFPVPPTRIITDKTPGGKLVTPVQIGQYYGYAVGNAMWAILAP